MSSQTSKKNKTNKKSKINNSEDIKIDEQENKINLIKRTLKNNTHIVLEDTRLKNITSWRKSQTKFMQNLVFNILSCGILHIISLYYPKLYLKLYCNPWPPKECDYFLVENIYGQFTLCSKIHKKCKNNFNTIYNNENSKENIYSSSLTNINNKNEHYLTKNLTYSFKYKSVTYEYIEETNEIYPVYMNLSKMTNKSIFNFFAEGLSSDNIIKKFKERYGKNEYYINLDLTNFYFKRIEILYSIFILIIEAINFIYKDIILFFVFLGGFTVLFLLEFLYTKKNIYELYKREFTIDGEIHKIKVKRKNKIINKSDLFCEIDNNEILPGDIIYLKSNDFVPCDCLILEGECIVNESNLSGSLDIFKKKSLENNNEQFNYELSKVNILYHGMKVVKTISKLNEGYISALCINTGPNTFKANQYSNILYLFERKIEYKKMYDIFGEGRKNIIFLIIGLFILTIIIALMLPIFIKVDINFKNSEILKLFFKSLVRVFIRSCMPVFFLTNSIIYFMGIYHLKNENILCFEKSKLTSPSNIDTIFFGKTGILCENNFEINGYHPIYINSHRTNNICYRTYKISQSKEMNSQLLKYYKEYLYKCQNNNLNPDFNPRQALRVEKNNLKKTNQEANECITLFLECLLSCNNIEKYNTEIFGNSIETTIFKNMKWDVKSYRFNNNIENNKEVNDDYLNEINENYKYNYDNDLNIIDRNINDIYPNNYYKITESFNKEVELNNKPIITRFNSKFYLEQLKKRNSSSNISEFLLDSNTTNFIKNDISQSHIISYKLRIYKRFIKNGSLNSSAIVYNFITKELRFMTKGIPEDIIEKCDKSTIPDNFDNIISVYRRRGLILIVCASKIISIDDYKESDTIDEYMNNLTFCGFVSLKNKLKKEIINSIKDLSQFDCNFIISTGDNVFNCLPIGFDSTIIENKNIFSFDKEDKRNKIIISKIYSVKKQNGEEEQEERHTKASLDKLSKRTLSSKVMNSPYMKAKDGVSIRGKKEISKNNDDFSLKKTFEENDKKNENKMLTPNKTNLKGVFNKQLKSSKNLIQIFDKNAENEKNQNISKYNTNYSEIKNNNSNLTPLNLQEKIIHNNYNKGNKSKQNNNDFLECSTNRKLINRNEPKNKTFSNLEKYIFYPGIFEDIADLTNNCIYCISGKAFRFLYENKEKRQCKKILEKIKQFCKIYFNMSSSDKSLVIDYYRENADNCVCTVGKDANDFDAIMTSNVGINLTAPNNQNTILCHFYSADSNILSIKKIIREGRTISENILLLKITSVFYTLIINSYIVCYFYFKIDIVKGQINFLEICFLILSISAFTVQYDENVTSNRLIQNKKLYIYHYIFQIIGTFLIKLSVIYLLYILYTYNSQLDKTTQHKIFCTYYFILCVEQLFSIFYVFNYISFYRKHPLKNTFFLIFNLLLIIYFVILITLNSSNYQMDFFHITIFEFNENSLDSFDDTNRLKCLGVCAIDFCCCFFFTKIIYYIFDLLAQKKSK